MHYFESIIYLSFVKIGTFLLPENVIIEIGIKNIIVKSIQLSIDSKRY